MGRADNSLVDTPERQCHGKMRFRTKPQAKLWLRRSRWRSDMKRDLVRVYRCPHCRFYHIGHKPGKKPTEDK